MIACLVAAACTDESVPPTGDPSVSRVETRDIPMYRFREIDLLFVIDNSPAMAAHADHLRESYGRFMAALESQYGGLADVHIGVVTGDLGARGADGLVHAPLGACHFDGDGGRLLRDVAPISGPFLSNVLKWFDTRETNYTGSLEEVFTALADVGASGCPFSQPLEAMRLALDHNPANAGFLRDEAYLAVVLITAGDDCSFAQGSFLDGASDAFHCVTNADELVPVDDYVRFLKSLKSDPSKVMVLTATGPSEPFAIDEVNRRVDPSCTRGSASATPARRIDALLEQFPDRHDSTSICDDDLGGVVELTSHLSKYPLGMPCIHSPLFDRDPDRAGTQPVCSVWLQNETDPDDQHLLPECGAAGDARCWTLIEDPVQCPLPTQQQLLQLRGRPVEYVSGTHMFLQCLVE
jgi:hypothetical protein